MATAAPFAQSGRLRILGVTSAKRLAAFPDVPTFEESGVTGMIVEHWWGVMAPAGVPQTGDRKAARRNRQRRRMPPTCASASPCSRWSRAPTRRSEFRALLETDVKRWAKVVKDAGIKIE